MTITLVQALAIFIGGYMAATVHYICKHGL